MVLKIKPFLIEQVESDYLVQKGFKQESSDLSVATYRDSKVVRL
jgi:hypothetical protein